MAERARRRRYDAAVLLPLLGAITMLPPVIGLFAAPIRIAGVPLIVLWLFGSWLVGILAIWRLSRLLDVPPPPER
ncbi:hypothetical protein [Roseobacter sp. HKCCA0434]|uniref:hypothetical protein n=1 Tax=Roseobacter sp. HKCCA0434 TaxID=3079297 RepID=UPI002905D247|nr:hypothetical protein [Roseobacter sp. HKCCA0434]